MPVKINIQRYAVEAKINGAFQASLPQLSEEILNDCNQYCKEDTGALIASSLTHSRPQEGKLIWQTPYARRQYWEIQTALTKGRAWRWCEYAKQRFLQKWNRQAQKLMEGNL